MKQATKKFANPHGEYPPEPDRTESGCKVGWNFYTSADDAAKCAKWAEAEARFKESIGYDFGYQRPGRVESVNGAYRVVVP